MPANEELKKLRKVRQSIRSKLTVFTKYVEKTEIGLINKTLLAVPVIELQDRLQRIENGLSDFEDIQSQIEDLMDEVTDDEYKYRSDFENDYFFNTAKVKALLISVSPPPVVSQSGSSSAMNPISSDNLGIKLPNIQLPKFNGNFEQWLEFHDSFKSMILDNASINVIQKFHYLKSCLSGSAEKIISSLALTEANFGVAWQLLCDRFSNEQLLIHNHIKAIFNIKPIRESSSCIRYLIDTVSSNLRSLDSLGEETKHWDSLIIYIVLEKLEQEIVKEWDKEVRGKKPTLDDLLQFLRNRSETLEKFEVRSHKPNFQNPKSKAIASRSMICKESSQSSHVISCSLCKGNHKMSACNDFQNLDVPNRNDTVKKLRLCFNCLHPGHRSEECKYGKCKRCSKKHHTLLHSGSSNAHDSCNNPASGQVTSVLSSSVAVNSFALLSTVIVQVRDVYGVAHNCRALLDCGSQSNFITDSLVSKLSISKRPTNISVIGIGQTSSSVKFATSLMIHSLQSTFSVPVGCLVVPSICDLVPANKLDVSTLSIPANIVLSDVNFNVPSNVDILIGAGLFWDLLCIGQVKLGPQKPVLQKTKLGWIISGPLPKINSPKVISCNLSQNVEGFDLSKFWDIEECTSVQPFSQEELSCEEHFKNTYRRNSDGRFVVTIPLKNSIEKLGESRSNAERQFFSLERRFLKNCEVKEQYVSFMNEYISMNHMSLVDDVEVNSSINYFFPHHGVVKEDSLTTRLRVVFNGSSPTSSGISFNDLQMVGPVLQNDLISILLRFRRFSYVISADIAKMYRQVLISPCQRNLQLILWRPEPSQPLQTYCLNTVTYGTAAASYLATRCVCQLAYDHAHSHQKASKAIERDFYVDNFLSGSDSVAELVHLCQEVNDILSGGCFPLRQWVSNSSLVLEGIQNSSFICDIPFLFGSNESSKTLGLLWCPKSDVLRYSIPVASKSRAITKRTILSGIAHIFDPLGLLSATVIKVKILMQRLWQEKIDWDQSVPIDIHTEWLTFREQLSHLSDLDIARHVILPESNIVEMHGFSDASESAYGAAIYLRSVNIQGDISVNLLCAKTKVAPLKKISIPRLELCGALILSRLVKKVVDSLDLEFNAVFLWSDSTIVLGWINTAPNILKTFVANRVSEIQSNAKCGQWRHVGSQANPADLLSRGIEPKILKGCHMWWHGPPFLKNTMDAWPSQLSAVQELPELKGTSHSLASIQSFDFPLDRFSSFTTLKRVVAYCLRFCRNSSIRDHTLRIFGPLTISELETSLICILKLVQRECFSLEFNHLCHHKPLSPKSKILALKPFLDEKGLIRVGGRLRNSRFSFEKKHPILVPARHHLTYLIFRYEHIRLLHAGPQHLLSIIRERYWPISGRSIARKIVRECVTCFRVNPCQTNPIMGDLPSSRVVPSFPFAVTGVDYAGYFLLKTRQGRNPSTYKAYVSLFVCLSTKALHLELVTDLTTACFIAALKRFIARRGRPAKIMSDNATNFVGCDNELKIFRTFLKTNQSHIVDSCTESGINWQFIPAHSPHFGGIWEAGVKSVKSHLKRVLSNALLTYEDFSTVLTQIEGVLNSRPLSPMSSDPSDYLPITPSHFLIGRPMGAIPEPDLSNVKTNRLTRFEHLQQLIQHFWKRWSLEYVSELQQRQKWKVNQSKIEVGTLVLVKNKDLPPLKWQLGRVEELHMGADGVTRVVTLRTSSGLIRRSVTNICPLPCE